MFRTRNILIGISFLSFISCRNEQVYHYAIKDFNKNIQSDLEQIVSSGTAFSYYNNFDNEVTDATLKKLEKAEHPLLRATALSIMLKRESFNHLDIIMNHLDDTAAIAVSEGEFGVWFYTVSDAMLFRAFWRTNEDKNKTIEAVITKHNYLRAAYSIIPKIKPEEKFYPFIKRMALIPRHYDIDGYELHFEDRESALYGLAAFRKASDVDTIKSNLMKKLPQLSNRSFQLMGTFQDSAYMSIFEEYYASHYYRLIRIWQQTDKAQAFLESVASYKNNRSAAILDSILNKKMLNRYDELSDQLKSYATNAIWNNKCAAYSQLLKKIEKTIKKEESIFLGPLDVDSNYLVKQNETEEDIRW